MSSKTFRLDRSNGKFLGVCAGIANYTGLDATMVRIGLGVLTIIGGFPWTVIAYFGAAWTASRGARAEAGQGFFPTRRSSLRDLEARMSDTDRRLAEVDRFVASPNTRLAREIDSLR